MAFCKYNDVCGRFRLNTIADEILLKKDVYNVLSTKVLMRKRWTDYLTLALIAIIIVLPLYSFSDSSPVSAAQRTLSWSIVNTPNPNNGAGGTIVNPSEINALALGPDNKTFYLANTASNTASIYKSTDAGVSWYPDTGKRLTAAGAVMPVWNVAISPDDPNFVVAITGSTSTGPTQAFITTDSGNNWQDMGLSSYLGLNEYINCLDISKIYGQNGKLRDIAVGIRNTTGTGSVYNVQFSSLLQGPWSQQTTIDSPLINNIYSLKFSPNYDTDSTIVVIYCDTTLRLTFGLHHPSSNTTTWNDASYGDSYPVNLNFAGLTLATLIGTDLALPSDFSANVLSQRGCFASARTDALSSSSRVYYVNTNLLPNVFNITPPTSGTVINRIASIAYEGSESSGILLAGEVFADPSKGMVNVWQSSNAQSFTVGGATWAIYNDLLGPLKSPTGGANSGGLANSILKWRADGAAAYCGTSSENSIAGGTGIWPDTTRWPFSKTIAVQFDESAFSCSLDSGITWNQIGFIDTQIDHLTDVAAMEEGGTDIPGETVNSVLYLATAENAINKFTSVWRSTSDPLGSIWERILLRPKLLDNGNILRINARKDEASKVVVFAGLQTDDITYSPDQGQTWQVINAGVQLNDIALQSDTRMYILENYTVRQINTSDSGWVLGPKQNLNMNSPSHTIWIPLKSPEDTEIVLVGSDSGSSSVAWADFSEKIVKFITLKPLPSTNSFVHVISDSKYEENQFIYAGVNVNTISTDGIIYRWKIGKSTNWDELDPPNRAFYGIETLNGVLYGASNFSMTDQANHGGLDRTLYPLVKVPPAPEWDDLTAGLPQPPPPLSAYPVQFNREPTSLKISSNSRNTLWVIDNRRPYTFDSLKGTGCLWSYIDSVARLGPWPTSPATGTLIGADPVTGRAQQIDFKWRPLTDIFGYDILIAKDVNFTLLLSRAINLSITDNRTGAWVVMPVDNRTGAWIVTPADQQQPSAWISPGVLEAGRPYYWRVRASRAAGGEIIHSPWSPVMLFSVQPGFAVRAANNGPTLLTPVDGPCQRCKPPVRFSWTPIKNATKYEFVLANDAQLSDVVVRVTTQSTAYECGYRLKLSKPYFWQVKAFTPVSSDPSPTGTFTLSENMTTPQNTLPPIISSGAFPELPSLWIWIIILIIAVLLFIILAYIFISRSRY